MSILQCYPLLRSARVLVPVLQSVSAWQLYSQLGMLAINHICKPTAGRASSLLAAHCMLPIACCPFHLLPIPPSTSGYLTSRYDCLHMLR